MKKLIAIIALLSLCSCGSQLFESSTVQSEPETTIETTTLEATTTEEVTTLTETMTAEETSIIEIETTEPEFEYTTYDDYNEPVILCDDENIKAECIGWVIGDDIFSAKVEIENKTDKNIKVITDNSSINDYEATLHFGKDITAGKKAVSYIVIDDKTMNSISIHGKDINKLEFIFRALDQDTIERLFESDIITLPIEQ